MSTTSAPATELAEVLGWGYDQDHNAVKVNGGGQVGAAEKDMNLGSHLVKSLAYALYGNEDALRYQWL